MIIYFVLFVIVYFLGIVWEKNRNRKYAFIFPSAIAIIVSLFAGFRNETVGTDVVVYAKPVIEIIKTYGVESLLQNNNVEFLYIAVAYLVNMLHGNLGMLLFFSQLIPISCYLLFINKENINASTAVLAYVTMFLGNSFNIMRQAIAMGIAIFSYTYIKNRNFKKFILVIFIATNFHRTALIFLPLYFIYGLKNRNKDYVVKFLIIFILIFGIVFFKDIFMMALDVGILPSKYNIFITEFYNQTFDIQVRALTYKIILFLLCYYFLTRKKYDNVKEKSFFKLLLIIDLLLYLLGAKISHAERISYYFSYLIYLYIIPRGISVENNNFYMKFIVNIMLVLYFILTYIILGFGDIIPYTSAVLGI